jgi:hypothetical protein
MLRKSEILLSDEVDGLTDHDSDLFQIATCRRGGDQVLKGTEGTIEAYIGASPVTRPFDKQETSQAPDSAGRAKSASSYAIQKHRVIGQWPERL